MRAKAKDDLALCHRSLLGEGSGDGGQKSTRSSEADGCTHRPQMTGAEDATPTWMKGMSVR